MNMDYPTTSKGWKAWDRKRKQVQQRVAEASVLPSYLIMDTIELKELYRTVNEDNAGTVAVHLEWLVRIHPYFKQWASLPALANGVARSKNKADRVRSSIDVILFTLRQRKTYRV